MLSFNVSPQTNVLDGIQLNEIIDRSTLMKLINCSLLKTTFNNPMAKIYTNEKNQLTAYQSLLVNGIVPVSYSRNENNPYGRSNPAKALGLFPIRREIRHTLASPTMVDLDIKNCHPEMLLQLCNAEGVPCPELKDYVSNRQVYFDEGIRAYGCSQDEIKRLCIIYLYGGGFDNWASTLDITKCADEVVIESHIRELDMFRVFRESIPPIHRLIANANPHLCSIVDGIKLDKGIHQYNLNGSVCSFVLQEYEIRVLEQLFIHCSQNGIIENSVCVLCADGLMIQRKNYKPELLDIFNTLVMETLGFNLVFTEKTMTQGYEKILDKNLSFDLINTTFSSGMLADYFSIMYHQFVSIDGDVFEYNGVYWKLMDKKHASLHIHINDVFYRHLISYGTQKQLIANQLLATCTPEKERSVDDLIKKIQGFVKNVQTLRKLKTRKEFVEDIIIRIHNSNLEFDANPYLFAFENKIYNLRTNSFIKPEPKQWIHTTCGYNYDDHYSTHNVETMKNLFISIFPDILVREYYLSVLATGLSGIRLENIFISTGSGGNGKSLINGMMMNALGQYSYKLPSSVILSPLKTGANPEVANLHNKRFAVCQEPDSKQDICAETVKDITGEKTLAVRFSYSNKVGFETNLTFVIECNKIPVIHDESADAIARRLRIIEFGVKAIPKDSYDNLEDKTGYCVQNLEYKLNEWQTSHRQALFMLLLPYWNTFYDNNMELPLVPESCKIKTNKYLATNNPLYSWFCDHYEKGDPTDFIYIDTLFTEYELTFVNTDSKLTKKGKSKFNKKTFTADMEGNMFIRSSFKQGDTRFNKKKHSKPYIVGYRLIQKEVVEEDTDDVVGCVIDVEELEEI